MQIILLTSLSSKAYHLTHEVTYNLLHFVFGEVSKVVRNILPNADQLTIPHLALLERPEHQKTNLTKLCKNLSTVKNYPWIILGPCLKTQKCLNCL